MKALAGRLLWFAAGAMAMLLLALAAYVETLRDRLPLEPWHVADLDEEFRAADARQVRSLADYLRREQAVFAAVDQRIYARVPAGDDDSFNRYAPGSRADPRQWQPDWNRTVALPAAAPVAGALLLHGASDSPYSLRALAEQLHARGFEVLALRLPGHGTAPAGLVRARWEDWAAATRIGARHVASRLVPGQPFYVVGYSMGGALAVEYALARLAGEDLPAPAGMILISPAIGVSPAAALAVWQARLAALPGLEQLAWSDLQPEYDPYKYGGFAVNAGDQVYRLTQRLRVLLDAGTGPRGVSGLPPILAFQSVADATVSTPALVTTLFARLAPEGHQLVLFDINRSTAAAQFLRPAMARVKQDLLAGGGLPFDLTVLGTAEPSSDAVVELRRAAGSDLVTRRPTGLAWPRATFSLSHVALPFRADDPLYGADPPRDGRIYLGRLEAQGERDVVAVPASALLRLRHNPFYGYLAARVDEFTQAAP